MSVLAGDPGSGTQSANRQVRSIWDFMLLSVAIIGLILLTVFLARHYGTTDATNAATILGIVVPAFATIGAAAFGITVAYSAGQAKGEASGQERVAQARTQGRAEAGEQLKPTVQAARDAIDSLKTHVEESSYSPPGERSMILGLKAVTDDPAGGEIRVEPEPFKFDPKPLDDALASLNQLHGEVNGFSKLAK